MPARLSQHSATSRVLLWNFSYAAVLIGAVDQSRSSSFDKEILMAPDFRKSLSAGLLRSALMSALLFVPLVSHSQVFFGSGGTTNTAINMPNLAFGALALFSNTTVSYNTANGYKSLSNNTTGLGNTAQGIKALASNTTGSFDTALGYTAGISVTTGSYNIAINNTGQAADNGVIRIGAKGRNTATYIAGINDVTNSGGVAVYIDANGQLGTFTSSRRFKNGIKDMDHASDKLMQLRPVTFRYKDAAEKGTHSLQYGLIAEEVAKVYPNLVQYDKAGKPFTIYYHLLTPMLLNELQKEHRKTEAQKAEVTAQKAEIAALKTAHTAEITALKSELAALKQSQQQQLAALAKLTTLVETSQSRTPPQSVVATRR